MSDFTLDDIRRSRKNVMTEVVTGDVQTIREDVSSDDGAYPTAGTGQNFSGYRTVRFYPVLGGTTPQWKITILMAHPDGSTGYVPVESVDVDDNTPFDVEVNGNPDVNAYLTDSSGTSPTITLKAEGIN